MARASFTYWLHALSPMHPGAGRGDGYIDLPVVREKVSGYPYVPGTTVKGVFADSVGATEEARRRTGDRDKVLRAAFGLADKRGGESLAEEPGSGDSANAGMLVFTDARLICMPARSLLGTFAWCTSPFVLRRLGRDLAMAGCPAPAVFPAPNPAGACVPDAPAGTPSALVQGGTAYLEDWDLPAAVCPAATEWAEAIEARIFPDVSDAWRAEFRKRFLVLPDDLFNFLTQTGTEVQAHVRIDHELKRVEDGALWYEETLPAETILAGLVWCDPVGRVPGVRPEQVAELCTQPDSERAVQIGGKASVGKGRSRLVFADGSGQEVRT